MINTIIIIQVREGLAVPQENLGIEWLAELVICSGFFLIYLVGPNNNNIFGWAKQ